MKALEIKITNPQNPLKCHNLLTDVKKGKIVFTPEFALDFLQSTNNRKNITDFVSILDSHLQNHPETASDYKRILYGITANRSQSEEIIKKAETLRQTYNITNTEVEITETGWEDNNEDYRCISKLIFPKKLANLQMEKCDLSETELDLSQSTFITHIRLDECKMPQKVDFGAPYIWAIYYKGMDISSFEAVYPEKMHFLNFDEKTKFPQVLDLSEIKEIHTLTFYDCDMSNIQEIKFPQSMDILHVYQAVLPACVDVEKLEQTSRVILNECVVPAKQKQTETKLIENNKNLKDRLCGWLKGKLGNAR